MALLPAAGAPAGAVGAYVLASLLGLAYSVPPLRMKCRGLAGLVCYSVCCATAYALMPAAWLRPPWQVLALTGALVLLDRWVNLNFHQVLDREADAAGGCATYAVRAEAGGARRTLRGFAVLASLAAAALLVFVGLRLRPWGTAVALVGAAAALAAWGYGALSRRLPDRSSPLIRELPPYYLGLTYAAFWVLPPLLLAGRAFVEPSVWVLAALAALSSLLTTARMAGYRHA